MIIITPTLVKHILVQQPAYKISFSNGHVLSLIVLTHMWLCSAGSHSESLDYTDTQA